MKARIIIVSFTLLLGACADSGAVKPTSTAATSAIAVAKAAERRVAAVGYEWRDTGAILNDAQKAADDKDYTTAIRLAGQAERQSLNAWVQYKAQRNAANKY